MDVYGLYFRLYVHPSLLVAFFVSVTDDQWHFSAGGTEIVGRNPDDRSEPLDRR